MAWLVKSRKLVFGGGLPILSIRNSAPCASWSCSSVNFMLSSRWCGGSVKSGDAVLIIRRRERVAVFSGDNQEVVVSLCE